jgi:hypothetical protein
MFNLDTAALSSTSTFFSIVKISLLGAVGCGASRSAEELIMDLEGQK